MLDLEAGHVKEVTALLIGRLGDLIVATPFLRALRARFPRPVLHLVVSAPCADAARMIPFVDEVSLFHKLLRPSEDLKLVGRLRRPADLFVDLNPSFSKTASALTLLSAAPVKLGFEKKRGARVLGVTVAPAGEREPMLDLYARLAAELGAAYEPATCLVMPVQAESDTRALLAGFGPRKGKRLMVHPGNFKKFDNRWPEEKFVELSDRLTARGDVSLFYACGPGEEAQVKALVARLKRPVPVLPPCPLALTGALMKEMDACLLNITGTTHLAAALGVPTFGFYSGYTNTVWRPRGPLHGGVVSPTWESCRDITVDEAEKGLQTFIGAAFLDPK